jgi:glycosyltransferase involved in cell wall biosynthesis
MTGPAIRYWEFARILSNYFIVTLAIPPLVQAESSPEELNPDFEVRLCKTQTELRVLTHTADVIITVGINLSIYPFLSQTTKPLVVDMYVPFILEGLQKYEDRPINERLISLEGHRGAHAVQVRSADFIICASEKQKDFWLGWLSALGRVNPYTHRSDPSLSKLIEVIPFGLPREAPIHNKQVLKGVYKTIAPDDKIILWGGGIWNWLDPQTLIKAMSLISKSHPEIKLFFMGIKSPNPYTAEMDAPAKAIKLSQELGVYNKYVFFNDWVPYHERQNYLLEADIGASLHLNHIETRFSFRTRLLDCIWAGLPILVSEGDTVSDEAARWELGKVVESGNIDQVSQAVVELLETPNLRQHYESRFDQIRPRYEWETVMSPLIKFCESPYLAADKLYLKHIPLVESGVSSWWSLPGKMLRTMRHYGRAELTRKTKEYLKWKLQR